LRKGGVMSVLNCTSKIFVAGHNGMVGSAIVDALKKKNITNILTAERDEVDLVDTLSVRNYFNNNEINYIVLAAAKVGGIYGNNTYPADFIYQNLMIEANVIHEAWSAGIKRILFLGSSCIYPQDSEQPMEEDSLLSGYLEPTNEPYAVAKIAGIKLCESYNRQHGTHYRSVMPTNLYGPKDNFHLENSHVIPALIKKFHDAKNRGDNEVIVWGTGNVRREFLHVHDMASACIHVMDLKDDEFYKVTETMVSHLNIGVGYDVTICKLAETVSSVVGYDGNIFFDSTKPEGPPRKLLNINKLKGLGWVPSIDLEDGLEQTYKWFVTNEKNIRQR
jgi:GDP-L-fucose synthase